MHLEVKNDNQRVWVQILGCKGEADIRAFFIADHEKPSEFNVKNGIIPYVGNGIYSFEVTCSGSTHKVIDYIGHSKPVQMAKQGQPVQNTTKPRRSTQKQTEVKTPGQLTKEKYDLSILTEDQLAELRDIVGENDLDAAMKFYRKHEIGKTKYCCKNARVLQNMRHTLEQYDK